MGETPAHFFHGDALGFVRREPVWLRVTIGQTDTSTTPQLFRTHSSHVNVEKSTFDGRGFQKYGRRRLVAFFRTGEIDCLSHR